MEKIGAKFTQILQRGASGCPALLFVLELSYLSAIRATVAERGFGLLLYQGAGQRWPLGLVSEYQYCVEAQVSWTQACQTLAWLCLSQVPSRCDLEPDLAWQA